MLKKDHEQYITEILLIIFLLVLPFLIFYWTLPDWWISSDDTVLLAFSAKHSFLEYAASPEVWRRLTNSNLTPLVVWLFDLDLNLFGLQPTWFYLHNLLIAACLAGLVYIILRMGIRQWIAAGGTIIFCLSPAYMNIVHQLMSRHYLEGLVWALLALLAFRYAVLKSSYWAALGSGLCYLVCILYKEIYAPLIVLLLLWPFTQKAVSWKQRLRALSPAMLAAAVYPLYRFWMLGVWFGGYGSLHSQPQEFSAAIELASSLIWPGAPWILAALIGLTAYATLAQAKKSILSSFFILALALGALLPLLQVLPVLSLRHLFLPSLLLILGAFLGLEKIWQKKAFWSKPVVILCLLLISASTFYSHIQARQALQINIQQKTIQGRFLWTEAKTGDVLLASGLAPWYVNGLQELAETVQNRTLKGRAILDLCYYFYVSGPELIQKSSRTLRYDASQPGLIPVQKAVLLQEHAQCMASFRPQSILKAEIVQDGAYVSWRFGPYASGTYLLVSPETGSTYPLPARGKVPGKLQDLLSGSVHLCYAHPDGWQTCKLLEQENSSYVIEQTEQE